MTAKFFEPSEMLIPTMQDLGEKVGEFLPRLATHVSATLKKRGFPVDDLPAPVKAVLPALLKAAAGGATIPRDAIPIPGELGRLVHLYVNEMLDGVGVGAARAAGGGASASAGAAGKPDDGSRKGYVVDNIWYPSTCTHRSPSFAGKGGGSPPPLISLVEALRRGHEVHMRGCVTDDEVTKAKAAFAAETSAASPSAPAEATATSPKVEHTLGDFILRLSEETGPLVDAYTIFIGAYKAMKLKDATIESKFIRAFHAHGTYRQFVFVATQPPSEWHMHLDALLGEVPLSSGGMVSDTVARELQETTEAFEAGVGHLEAVSASTTAFAKERTDALAASREQLKKLREGGKPESGKPEKPADGKFMWALALLSVVALAVWQLGVL